MFGCVVLISVIRFCFLIYLTTRKCIFSYVVYFFLVFVCVWTFQEFWICSINGNNMIQVVFGTRTHIQSPHIMCGICKKHCILCTQKMLRYYREKQKIASIFCLVLQFISNLHITNSWACDIWYIFVIWYLRKLTKISFESRFFYYFQHVVRWECNI